MYLSQKIQKIISLLAICFVTDIFVFSLQVLPLLAETIKEATYSNRQAEIPQKILKSEKIDVVNNCSGKFCFLKPSSISISQDGSFFLVANSHTSPFLRKFNFSSGTFTDGGTINLKIENTKQSLFKVSISQNNKKVLVYNEATTNETSIIQIIDLISNTIRFINPETYKNFHISVLEFADINGDLVIGGSNDSGSSKLFTIDLRTNTLEEIATLSDIPKSINITPDSKKAIITYKNILAQSFSIYNFETKNLLRFDTPSNVFFPIDDFLEKIDFDLFGNWGVLSSLDGLHVLHLIDLKNDSLRIKILDNSLEGQTLSTITPDGKTIISISNILENPKGIKVYKINNTANTAIPIEKSLAFRDGSSALDIHITPDQSKILALVIKDNEKKIKVFNLQDLSQVCEYPVSNDIGKSQLFVEPYGRYFLTQNTNDNSITTISNLKINPILNSITPNSGSINGGTPFEIDGFIDLSKFSNNIKVCFRNNDFCASSVSISNNGRKITGITPKFISPTLEDLILSGELISNQPSTIQSNSNFGPSITIQCSDQINTTTRYKDIFKFVDESVIDEEDEEMEEVDIESTEQLGSNIIMGYIELKPPPEEPINIPSLSVELSNLPPIPQGKTGIITKIPTTPGFKLRREDDLTLNIPRGCSFATIIIPKDSDIEVKDGDINNRYPTVLIDSNGMAFLAGFAFFVEKSAETKNFNGINEIFQTSDSEALDLVTTISIPYEAAEGNAKVEILGDDIPLITVPIIITKSDEVKAGKKRINIKAASNPKIKKAVVKLKKLKKPYPKLILKVTGTNIIRKRAIINNNRYKLIGKGNFFTKIDFIPSDGIEIKKSRFKRIDNKTKKLIVTTKIDKDIKSGIRLFNITTPKCADIGAFIIPDKLSHGKLQSVGKPERIILEDILQRYIKEDILNRSNLPINKNNENKNLSTINPTIENNYEPTEDDDDFEDEEEDLEENFDD